jgi:hypothetical protein
MQSVSRDMVRPERPERESLRDERGEQLHHPGGNGQIVDGRLEARTVKIAADIAAEAESRSST